MTNIDCSEPKNDQISSSSSSSSARDKNSNSDKVASSRDGRFVRSNKDEKNEDCGKLMEIFQIPSGATKLSLTQSQSSNNLIRKLLLDSAIKWPKLIVESIHEGWKETNFWTVHFQCLNHLFSSL